MTADTFVTRLTPVGRGALSTISVEGPQATALVDQLFRPASASVLATFPPGRIVFGHWTHADGRLEEVVVSRRADASVEVHCHGGRAAAQAVIDALAERGARRRDQAGWAEAHAADRIEAAARIALTQATTERCAAVLLDQYRGALRRCLREVVKRFESGDSGACGPRLARLAELAVVGRRLTSPWRVVCAGPPNVGKSSLLNALLGFERAIVWDQPGTTRDLVVAQTALDGWPVELSDTAGLHAADDEIEREGVARAQAQMAQADLVVLIFDASEDWLPRHQALLQRWPAALVVANKLDLIPRPLEGVARWETGRDIFLTSARCNTGMDQLSEAIVARLVPQPPCRGEAVPFTAQQCEGVEQARSLYAGGECAAAIAVLSQLL